MDLKQFLVGDGSPDSRSLLGFLGDLPGLLTPGSAGPVDVPGQDTMAPGDVENLKKQYQRSFQAAQAKAVAAGQPQWGVAPEAAGAAQDEYGNSVQKALATMETLKQQKWANQRHERIQKVLADQNLTPAQKAALGTGSDEQVGDQLMKNAFPNKALDQPVPVTGGYVYKPQGGGDPIFVPTKQDEKLDVLSDGTVVKVDAKGNISRNVPKENMGSARVAEMRVKATNPDPGFSPQARQLIVQRLANGEKLRDIVPNMGRGAQGAADLKAIQNDFAQYALDHNMSAQDIAANVQDLASQGRALIALGAREGNIAARAQEVVNFAGQAIDISNRVDRGNWTDLTKAIQFVDRHFSDPDLAEFNAANVSLINAYAAAVGGGQIHQHDQEVARTLLATADGPEAYARVVHRLILEAQQAEKAPRDVRGRMKDEAHAKGVAAGGAKAEEGGWKVVNGVRIREKQGQ